MRNGTHFELRDEDEVGDVLGIRIEKSKENSFMLSQKMIDWQRFKTLKDG